MSSWLFSRENVTNRRQTVWSKGMKMGICWGCLQEENKDWGSILVLVI